eukprot:scaffold85451_cov38-Phaeocystis_antarctica.AAC.1
MTATTGQQHLKADPLGRRGQLAPCITVACGGARFSSRGGACGGGHVFGEGGEELGGPVGSE